MPLGQTNILAGRLKRLELFGIITPAAYQDPAPPRVSLTPEDKRLGRVLRELADRGLENIAGKKKIVPGSFKR